MSPDWADKPEAVPYSDLGNPQSLNLYGSSGGYDPVGNVTSANDLVMGNWSYTYDTLNRLVGASVAAGSGPYGTREMPRTDHRLGVITRPTMPILASSKVKLIVAKQLSKGVPIGKTNRKTSKND